MLISSFNRYFEKHGRKTYIVLGIIISLMFVVFVSGGAGDIFSYLGGRGQLTSFGTMYGKKLKVDEMQKRMSEFALMQYLYNPYANQMNNAMVFHGTLNQMRLLHVAKSMKLDNVTDEEIAEEIRQFMIFRGDNGQFSLEKFKQFKENYLSGELTARDFDRMVKESIIANRVQQEVTKDVTVDEAEVNSYVEKYNIRYAVFPVNELIDAVPSDEEIADFFAKRKSEITLTDSRYAVVAIFGTKELLDNINSVPEPVRKRIIPDEEAITARYEMYRTTAYNGKELAEVRDQIIEELKASNARKYQQEWADKLSMKFAEQVENENADDRLARFREEAVKMSATVIDAGRVTELSNVPGVGDNEATLAASIRSLDKVGEVSSPAQIKQGYAVSILKERKPTPMPEEINAEVRGLIIEKLVAEKAVAMYNEKIAPYATMAPECHNDYDFSMKEYQSMMADNTLNDEQRQLKLMEHQRFVREMVMPFYVAEKRSFSLVAFDYSKYEGQVTVSDDELQAAYDAKASEYQKKQVRLSRINFSTKDLTGEALEAKKAEATAALAELGEGVAFEELGNATTDQGLLALELVPAAIRDGIEGLEAGQVSGVIEMPESFTIVKVVERDNGKTLEMVKATLTAEVKSEKCKAMALADADALVDAASERIYDKADAFDKDGRLIEEELDPNEILATLKGLASASDKTEVLSFDNLSHTSILNAKLGRDSNVMDAMFKLTAKSPMSLPIAGEKAAYIGVLNNVTLPFLRNPADDNVAMNSMKRIYRRRTALDKDMERTSGLVEKMNASLKDGKKIDEVAGDAKFIPVAAFSRIDSQPLLQFVRPIDSYALLASFSKIPVNSVCAPFQIEGNSVAVIYLESKEIPATDETKEMLENVRSYLLRRNQQEALSRYSAELEKESDTKLVEGLF